MGLNRQAHNSFQEVTDELRHLDTTKQEVVTFSTRAPTATDTGRFWVKATGASTLTFYVRDNISKVWRSASFS